ncbi:hypothetical protein [Chryseobacterium indologenes]|uniref:hypothetical protein n=1 Tax=Chryseobacterium indologenes TaxID=253 RepID=UPI00102471CA|nr:hypothetical protein [Chryseobacterium indologenes]VFA41233.1 Uncharacterised protein [Chryseobacterium indologenes]
MKKLYVSALLLCAASVLSAHIIVWQKDIKPFTQAVLSQGITIMDQQYLITGSSNQNNKQQTNKQNNSYDFRLVNLNQQGEPVREKYFSENESESIPDREYRVGSEIIDLIAIKTDANKVFTTQLIKK